MEADREKVKECKRFGKPCPNADKKRNKKQEQGCGVAAASLHDLLLSINHLYIR